MSKVFRLYKDGSTTIEDWGTSPAFTYGRGQRDDAHMPDPDGATASKEITSIPSPFARIDLVKNAFYEITRQKTSIGLNCLNGNTIFHKMVSDTLDVGEIFFNYDRFSSLVEIIAWNPITMTTALIQSQDEGQNCYGDALNKFIQADGTSYNFDKLQNIYLLNYIHGPQQLNIIGATSPASVFFSTANKIDYIKNIQFGKDYPFDQAFQPLYKRDPAYIKFWFLLRNTIPGFSRLFPEVDAYLELTYEAISDNNLKQELNAILNPALAHFSNISVKNGTQMDQVEVLGHPLYQKSAHIGAIKSDFTINSTKQPDSNVLVLPVESGNMYKDLHYTTDSWGDENKAPFKDKEPNINLRKLPNDYTQHPYLTISDFLEDTLIEVPHNLNSKSFLALNSFLNDNNAAPLPEGKTYLLPLKPLFFEFFTVNDLENNLIGCECMACGNIKVTLRIPIKGNGEIKVIEYSRLYFNGNANITQCKNEGGIINADLFKDFEILVLPNIRFPQGVTPEYRIATIAPFSNKAGLKFYKDGLDIPCSDPIVRNSTYKIVPKSQTYILSSDFECLQVVKQGANGMLIPTFDNPNAAINSIAFTVDLGTSNTHIEMVQNNQTRQIQTFGFTQAEQLQVCAFLPTKKIVDGKVYQTDLVEVFSVIERDFLPLEVNSNGDYNLPTRTVLSFGANTNWDQDVRPWANSNISFPFGKQEQLQYNKYETNIKWSEANQANTYAKNYIDNLMFLLRCKALVVGANVQNVPVTWFYPTSMSPRRRAAFTDAWQQAYNKYFGGNALNSMTESLAPVLHFFNKVATATDLITVDIGGGTTDLAFASNKNVQYVSSFRFAANSLFEDSFSEVNPQNGVVDYFRSIYESLNISELNSLLKEFDSQPANMASTFYTLKDSPIVKREGIAIDRVDFNKLLFNDNNFKVVFWIFYSAIIYHIGQIIKVNQMSLPRHIAFSGNGANIIRALVPINRDGLSILSKYTKTVLEMVTGQNYGKGKLDILGFDQGDTPKRATCRGGFLGDGNTYEPEKIVFKSSDSSLVTNADTYDAVDKQYINKVVSAVESFYDFLFEKIAQRVKLCDNFGISNDAIELAKKNCSADIDTYIRKGIEIRKAEQSGSDVIAETFFFYPIKGALQTISQEINSTL